MQTNILEYLERTVLKVPNKIAYTDGTHGLTFLQVYEYSRSIGSFLANSGYYREPIVIYMKKSPEAVAAFFGTVYGGCYYVPFDEEMPKYRVSLILETLKPRAILCDQYTEKIIHGLNFEGNLFHFEDIIKASVDITKLNWIRMHSLDIDPIYIVFTSGSTGVPKGVVACHRSVLDYVENLSDVLGFNENTVFGNQSPLYFDACLKELYPTMMFGATTFLIPKGLFMFPVKLVEYLNEHKINTVCWVVSALSMISSMGTFESIIPKYLHTIAFGSEVFPIKQFNIWRKTLPNAKLFNLYGPTECTGMSCYYHVNREFDPSDVIPIGKPFKNTEILLLTDENQQAIEGETGEICIRGTCVTLGYYNNPEKTSEVFVQNPLNKYYPELIYRTGDIGKYNEYGELVFVSRKDHQIKHMGHRIELGEIEIHANQVMGIRMACCIYDKKHEKIVLFYVGEALAKNITKELKAKLPRYMIPNQFEQLNEMPLTANGKINRMELKKLCEDKE